MSGSRYIDRICAVITAFAVILTVLFMNGTRFGLQVAADADAETHSDDTYFTENDLDANWDTSGASQILLEGDTASVSGSGCYLYENTVVIAESGKYVVSGSLTDGSIVVDAYDNSKVWILFDGVQINREDDACLIIDQADKVFLTLAEGSDNVLTSGTSYSEEALEDNTDGAVFAHDDLTINGSGTLTVTAGCGHGISANDDLVITGGSIFVTAAKDGIHANDSLRITGAAMEISAQDDGLAADNEGAYIYIDSGEYVISCADEGICAPGDITIAGGSFRITTGTEKGHHGIKSGGTCTVLDGSILVDACYEGIQAHFIDIRGGDLTIFPTDDGLNASVGGSTEDMFGMGGGRQDMGGEMPDMEGMTEGEDGNFSGPQGIGGGRQDMGGEMPDMGSRPDMGGETQDMEGMTEGEDGSFSGPQGMGGRQDIGGETPDMEGMTEGEDGSFSGPQDMGGSRPDMGGEMPDMGSRPDMGGETPDMEGMTEGEDGESSVPQGMAGEMQEMEQAAEQETEASGDTGTKQEEMSWLHISGGNIQIINTEAMDADGLDSNGDILISGGTIRVSLEESGSNNAIDYGSESEGVCEITGGTVIACGSSSMAEGFDTSSSQGSILYSVSSGMEAGTRVSLLDEDGNELLAWEVPCGFSAVTFSCPEMETGETYTVVLGDSSEQVELTDSAVSAGDARSAMSGGAFRMGTGMQMPAGAAGTDLAEEGEEETF